MISVERVASRPIGAKVPNQLIEAEGCEMGCQMGCLLKDANMMSHPDRIGLRQKLLGAGGV